MDFLAQPLGFWRQRQALVIMKHIWKYSSSAMISTDLKPLQGYVHTTTFVRIFDVFCGRKKHPIMRR